ncbi:MAG: hypothetical protein KF760_26420 [Candidatus Eremiobacteraeota bacterium]|nr:hypothetical protein [Candidatus Eremiobacteraeota bacterium]MCW5869530.1 hypothetical protein [Candidatus Eremiobacteraeota bacterium]
MKPTLFTSRSNGFTLLEIMVAGSLTVLGFFFLLTLLLRTSGVMNRVLVVSQLQQNCEMTVNRVANFASRCDVAGVSFVQDPALTGLSLHPVDDIVGSNYKRYAAHTTLFSWTPSSLTLVETNSDPLLDDQRWQPSRLDADAIGLLSLKPPARILSKSVARMELYSPDQNCPLLMRLDFLANAPGYGPQRVRVERYLNVRDAL